MFKRNANCTGKIKASLKLQLRAYKNKTLRSYKEMNFKFPLKFKKITKLTGFYLLEEKHMLLN